MLYYLFDYFEKLGLPGAGVFQYISFRAGLAFVLSLLFGIIFGKRTIKYMKSKQIIGEIRVKDIDKNSELFRQMEKKGTPTMGGIIIVIAILLSTLLLADLTNIYIILMIITTVWLAFFGFIDDYLKIKHKNNKAGLSAKMKLICQIFIGVIVGGILYLSPDVVVRYKTNDIDNKYEIASASKTVSNDSISYTDIKTTKTTIPFFKNNEFDYSSLLWFLGDKAEKYGWIIFILATIFIVTAVSNGSNLTDGLDGLNVGVAAIVGVALGILAYVSGNAIAANYLNILWLPNTGELTVFIASFIGAAIAFLWFNCFPAQIFMGDVGSLTIGGIIAVIAIIIKKELLLPILCGVYLVETLSVIIQKGYFKYSIKKYGEKRKYFLKAPIHHHFQMKNMFETKIAVRFWIISILLAVISIITLKLR